MNNNTYSSVPFGKIFLEARDIDNEIKLAIFERGVITNYQKFQVKEQNNKIQIVEIKKDEKNAIQAN